VLQRADVLLEFALAQAPMRLKAVDRMVMGLAPCCGLRSAGLRDAGRRWAAGKNGSVIGVEVISLIQPHHFPHCAAAPSFYPF